MKEYFVLEAVSHVDLCKAVSNFLCAGWTCQGGISVVEGEFGMRFSQAMVR